MEMKRTETFLNVPATPLNDESGYFSTHSAEFNYNSTLNSEEVSLEIKYRHEEETPFIPKSYSLDRRSSVKFPKMKLEQEEEEEEETDLEEENESYFLKSCDVEMEYQVPQIQTSISNYENQMEIEEDTLMNHSFYDLLGPIRTFQIAPRLLPQKRPTLEGEKHVDFLACLGKDANFKVVVDNIFNYLEPKDLAVITMVSKAWKSVCLNHKRANKLRIEYLEVRKKRKENLINNRTPKKKFSSAALVRNGYLTQLQSAGQIRSINQNVLPKLNLPTSPPVSPSKRKFHNYLKAAQKCSSNETVTPCPRCMLPAIVQGNRGRCSKVICEFEFCTLCRAPNHLGTSCHNIQCDPRRREGRIGSKRSKGFLRRL